MKEDGNIDTHVGPLKFCFSWTRVSGIGHVTAQLSALKPHFALRL